MKYLFYSYYTLNISIEHANLKRILTSIVFPFPGGPKSNKPLAGARSPVNNSGLREGRITISCNACFASS